MKQYISRPISSLIMCSAGLALVIGANFACKSDSRGTADEALHIAFDDDGGVLASFERVFHTTSSTSQGGAHFISGYNRYRISVVNLTTGALQTRLVTGDNKHMCEFVGLVGNDLWCYSYDQAIGLHARNIVNLQVSRTEKEILFNNPDLSQGLVKGVSSVSAYFWLDSASKNIVATTIDGRVFMIDPQTLAARLVDSPPPRPTNHLSVIGRYAQSQDGRRFNLVGELRLRVAESAPGKPLAAENPKAEPLPSFLNANFVCDAALEPDHSGYPPILQDRGNVFMLQDSKIGPDAKPLLTCVDPNRNWAVVWQSSIPGIDVAKAHNPNALKVVHVWRDALIVAAFPAIHSFNRKTGQLQWSYPF